MTGPVAFASQAWVYRSAKAPDLVTRACNTTKAPRKITNRMSRSLRYFSYPSV
jgi:hypothetical protein